MRNQKFGIEIEMTGITRATAARIIAGYFGTQATHVGGIYDTYTVRDNNNRQLETTDGISYFEIVEVKKTNCLDETYNKIIKQEKQYLLLSTCYSKNKDGRLLITAIKV